jgi:hypothetical protein
MRLKHFIAPANLPIEQGALTVVIDLANFGTSHGKLGEPQQFSKAG